jgi:ribonuclease HI
MSSEHIIEIYTDGACSPNPGRGGYGIIIVQQQQKRELSGGFRKTTNNRMEILAAVEGLKEVTAGQGDGLKITIFSDSRYLVDMFNEGHARRWRAKGWMRGPRDRAKNEDLWGQLLDLATGHQVRFVWVKSHNEHPENERCDQLAVEARQKGALPPDEQYENPRPVPLSVVHPVIRMPVKPTLPVQPQQFLLEL